MKKKKQEQMHDKCKQQSKKILLPQKKKKTKVWQEKIPKIVQCDNKFFERWQKRHDKPPLTT